MNTKFEPQALNTVDQAMRKLRALVVTAHAKMVKNQYKDSVIANKWQKEAHAADGRRTWRGASRGFLLGKLCEEMLELMAASPNDSDPSPTLLEAGDVAAMTMMAADRCIGWERQPPYGLPPKVVCLCGSTKFKDAFMEHNKRLTLEGHIVLSVGCFPWVDDKAVPEDFLGVEKKAMLDELHKRKIDLSDEIFVLNVSGYIGSSTRGEIEYATLTCKGVQYLE